MNSDPSETTIRTKKKLMIFVYTTSGSIVNPLTTLPIAIREGKLYSERMPGSTEKVPFLKNAEMFIHYNEFHHY